MKIFTLQIGIWAFLFCNSIQAQIASTPDNCDAGATNYTIQITGTGTNFIPGITTCAEVWNPSSSFGIVGSASSATEFTGQISVPVFAQPGVYDLRIFQGPLCSGTLWTCSGCFIICNSKTIIPSVTDASCFGCPDGGIDLTVFGGAPPFTFNWSDGSNSEDLTNISAGTYSVTINDDANCDQVETYVVSQPEPISVMPSSANRGSIQTVSVTGAGTGFIPGTTTCAEIRLGSEVYSFSGEASDPTNFSADLDIPISAPAGNYDFIIYEGPGCSGAIWGCAACFTVCIPMDISGNVNNAICTGCPNGSVDLTVTGGAPPFNYAWSNGWNFEDLTGVPAGVYTVSVTDAFGCMDMSSFEVFEPDPINITPDTVNPGFPVNFAIIGSTTSFIPGTTNCVEFSLGPEIYSTTGIASSATVFNGSITMPGGASPGNYDVTVFEGPGCTGPSWKCNQCFTVNDPFVCGGFYFDQGGPTGNYSNNSNQVVTICPDNSNDVVSVNFTTFNIENNLDGCYDELRIYDGADVTAPIIPSPGAATDGWCWDRNDPIPTGSGDLLGQTIISRESSGCLTFSFVSNVEFTRSGWEAAVICNPRLVISPGAANPGESVSTTVTGVGTDFTPGITTCAEITRGASTYTITGTATSPTAFSGLVNLPLDAPAGLYNLTVFKGPGCTGSGFAPGAWTCTDCFEVLGNLPLELLSFSARANRYQVDLNWITATEEKTSHFEIQQSKNGMDWRPIGEVTAAGQSDENLNYNFTDSRPVIGKNYYRLRLVDLDGVFSYSNVEVVEIVEPEHDWELIPNPVAGNAMVSIPGTIHESATLFIADVSGRLIYTEQIELYEGINNHQLDLWALPPGMYFMEIESKADLPVMKFVKM